MPFPIRNARAADAVPAGRVPYDLHAPELLLHTIQTADAFDKLAANGILIPDPAKAEADYGEAYAWMLCQMNRRLPTRGSSALWLWARMRREHLVDLCKLSPGQVLLTCLIPRERVLLSEFTDWHNVLNGVPNVYLLPDEHIEQYGDRYDAIVDRYESETGSHLGRSPRASWPAAIRTEIESSWEGIFDVTNYGRGSYWQATVHELHAKDVIEAVRIVG